MPIVLDPSKSFVNITLFYIEQKKEHGNSVFHFVASRKEFDEWKTRGYRTEEELRTAATEQSKVPVDPTKIIEKIITTWKRLTWKDQNTIYSRCLKTVPGIDGKPTVELDTILYRDLKLKTCLKKWDIRDESGQILAVAPETIDLLVPEVAQEMLNAFERVTEASSFDLGE